MVDDLRPRNYKPAILIATGLLVFGTLVVAVQYPSYKRAKQYVREERLKSDLVARYRAAECVPAGISRRISPQVRDWDDTTLATKRGVRFSLWGAEWVGEVIESYFDDGARIVVANAGDYVYPHEVRFSAVSGRIYVRADGLRPLANRHETWLFEYDADDKRGIKAVRVNPQALPSACPDKRKVSQTQ